MAKAAAGPPSYPAHWEADVVLRDGAAAHLRPITPQDADALQAFHVGQSQRSVYLRFFGPMERLSETDLARFTQVDYVDRVALVAVTPAAAGERIIGVARYERIDDRTAEVAFTVADAHQGRGLGSVLLEHLAATARERGVRRFVAEVLPQNGAMLSVFDDAGYELTQHLDDGLVTVHIDLDPSQRSRDVMADREHRAEYRSMQAIWDAQSLLLVGPGVGAGSGLDARRAGRLLTSLLRVEGDLPHVHTVGLEVPAGLAGDSRLIQWDSVAAIPGPVDLAALATPPPAATAVVHELARLAVRAVVVLSAGFAEQGEAGLAAQRELVRAAHAGGMRVVGPESFGLVRPGAPFPLDASLAVATPAPGNVGLFCQSAPVALALLDGAIRRGLGVSQLLSAGNRADVSGNDMMQFWGEDPSTRVAALALESIGNPRKFVRVARRLAREKPVVVVTAGRSGHVVPPGHAVVPTTAPRRTLDAMFAQSGVLRVDLPIQVLDVAMLLAHQPVPAGRRVGVVASSHSVAALATENLAAAGLTVTRDVVVVPEDVTSAAWRDALVRAAAASDAVAAVFTPTAGAEHIADRARELAEVAAGSPIAWAACVLGLSGITAELTAPDAEGAPRTVPAFRTPGELAVAMGHAARYAAWLARDHGTPVRPEGVDKDRARNLAMGWLADDDGGRVGLGEERSRELLGCVGIEVAAHGPSDPVGAGVACVLRSWEDPLYGPVIAFGLAGDATELLGDVGYAIAPLTTGDVADLVRSVRAAPRLFGYRGSSAVAVAELEDVIARLAVLADDLPELASAELDVLAHAAGVEIVGATVDLAPGTRADGLRRALPAVQVPAIGDR